MIDFKACEVKKSRLQNSLDINPYHAWDDSDALQAEFYRVENNYLFRLKDLVDFYIQDDGTQFSCFPVPDIDDRTIEHLFRNNVWPFMLNRRGEMVFHAACVEIEERAIAFLGESGMGKSTLASHFATTGYRFLSDDGLWVREDGNTYMAQPNAASIRLWDESYRAVIPKGMSLAPELSFTQKSCILASDRLQHCDTPRPLNACFFLANEGVDKVLIEPLTGIHKHMAFAECSFVLDAGDHPAMHRNFETLADFASDMTCFTLDYPRNYRSLDEIIEAVKTTLG